MPPSEQNDWQQRLDKVLAIARGNSREPDWNWTLAGYVGDTHPEVRRAAAETLFQHDPNAVKTLVSVWADRSAALTDDMLCDDARREMRNIETVLCPLGEQIVAPLLEVLRERYADWSVAEEVARLLARIETLQAIEPLTDMMYRHSSLAARQAAAEALEAIRKAHGLADIPALSQNPPNFLRIEKVLAELEDEDVPVGKDSYVEFEAVDSHRCVWVVKSRPDDDWSIFFHVQNEDELSHALNLFNSFSPSIENPEQLKWQLDQARRYGRKVSVRVCANETSFNALSSVHQIFEYIYKLPPDFRLAVRKHFKINWFRRFLRRLWRRLWPEPD